MSTRHILLVDNHPQVPFDIGRALARSGGYGVGVARTGREALPLFRRKRLDLVLVEASLPDMSGIEVTAHATARGIPVILMTPDPLIDTRLDRLGWPHLRKPVELDRLLAEVQATLRASEAHHRLVRETLRRFAKTSGELGETITQLRRLRERTQQTLARARGGIS